VLAVRLASEIEKRLDELAKKTGRTKTFYVREAILEHLDDLEGYYLAEERLKKSDPHKRISLEKLMRLYGLED
jgi:RHH-type rel operon transcriptional repressor/antitoxin RelB